jgi:hypothetical protein
MCNNLHNHDKWLEMDILPKNVMSFVLGVAGFEVEMWSQGAWIKKRPGPGKTWACAQMMPSDDPHNPYRLRYQDTNLEECYSKRQWQLMVEAGDVKREKRKL